VSTVTKSQKCCYYANFLFFLRSVSNDSSDSLFLRGVSMSPAWLNSLSTGADDGTLVWYLTNTQILPQLLKFM